MLRFLLMVQFLLCFLVLEGRGNGFSLDSLSTRQVWLASQLLPGSGQVINRQYWKPPIYLGAMGAAGYMGYKANRDYRNYKSDFETRTQQPFYGPEEIERYRERYVAKRTERNLYYAGLYSFYVASIADALIVHSGDKHSPATATVLSLLVPGLGQMYNQKYWKVPVIYGGIATLYYVTEFNHRGYIRFRTAYEYQTDNNPDTYNYDSQNRSRDDIIYFKDAYRRNRDLTLIIMAGFYILNVIDANIDAHFYDWDISDDLSFRVDPYIEPNGLGRGFASSPTTGLRFSYTF